MMRIEAYTVLDGLCVRVVCVCTGQHPDGGPKCEGWTLSTTRQTHELERWGEGETVSHAVHDLLTLAYKAGVAPACGATVWC